jgi:ferredoxin
MVKKYKIVYDRDACISAKTCIEFYKKFKISKKDDKADLVGSKEEKGQHVLVIGEKDFEKAKQAAQSCPVNVIHIYDMETNEKMI